MIHVIRRALVLGLLCLMLAASAETPNLEFERKLARFHEHYNRFMRELLGCAKNDAYIEQCRPSLGTFDMAEFNHAARDAGPLFGLERKKD